MEFITCRSLQTVTSPRPVHLADPGTWRRVCRAERSEHPPRGWGTRPPASLCHSLVHCVPRGSHLWGRGCSEWQPARNSCQFSIPPRLRGTLQSQGETGPESLTNVWPTQRILVNDAARGRAVGAQAPCKCASVSAGPAAPLPPTTPPPRLPRLRSAEGTSPGSPAEEPRGNGDWAWKRSVSIAWLPAPSLVPNALRTEPPAPHALSLPQGTR